MTDYLALAKAWLAQDPDPVTAKELESLISANNLAELESRFASRLQFGTAGLRGELGAGSNRMNRVLVAQAAAGLGRYLGTGSSVVIGFDGRINSDVFAKDSAEILAGMGIKVFLLDEMCPTPLISFATRYLNASAGIMVTASHNPPKDNGYKLYLGGDFHGSQIISPIDSEIEKQIELVAESETFASLPKSSDYELIGQEIRTAYYNSVVEVAGKTGNQIKIAYTAMHGVGWKPAQEVFAMAGHQNLIPVSEQILPDGNFPTVTFPNPEEPGAMDLALAKGEETSADLVIANDPDADRVAVAVWHHGKLVRLTGDQVGLILGDEIAKRRKSGTLACSIVSSSALEKVAEFYELGFAQTLTGFKWISKAPNLVYGYEEALGYCIDPEHVADKDGISAALLLANIAAKLKTEDKTLVDLLSELGNRYGHFATGQISLRFSDLVKSGKLVEKLRSNPPTELSGQKLALTDLAKGSKDLPPTDGLRFDLEDGSRVIIRPSGTEPKLKCYLQVVGNSAEEAEGKLQKLTQDASQLLSNLN